jgi:hypothetical protein
MAISSAAYGPDAEPLLCSETIKNSLNYRETSVISCKITHTPVDAHQKKIDAAC